MFQDFAGSLAGAEVEVYYYWFTLLLLLSNILLRFLVFPEIFKEMVFYQVVGRKVQEEGETISHDIGEEKQHNKRDTNHIFFIHQKQ